MGVFLSLSDTRARNPSKSQVMWAFTLLPGELIPTYYRSSRSRTPTTPWRRRKRLIPCLYIMDPCHNQKGNNGEFDLLNFLSAASKLWGHAFLRTYVVMQTSFLLCKSIIDLFLWCCKRVAWSFKDSFWKMGVRTFNNSSRLKKGSGDFRST